VEVLEVELSSLVQAQKRGQTMLEALKESRQRLYGELDERQRGEMDLFMIAQLRTNLKMVGERMAEQQARLQALAGQIQAKREEVVVARQDEEVLENLKRKESDRWQAEQAQAENRMQDDLYIAQAYRSDRSRPEVGRAAGW
jgi:flagellar export protein FliJ